MLTVIPAKRANVENICSHWWVNESYSESCLEIAENLANQTPVRLDLLLSLAPRPASGGDQVVVPNAEDMKVNIILTMHLSITILVCFKAKFHFLYCYFIYRHHQF